jgi:hypothetical protein
MPLAFGGHGRAETALTFLGFEPHGGLIIAPSSGGRMIHVAKRVSGSPSALDDARVIPVPGLERGLGPSALLEHRRRPHAVGR